MNNYKKHKNNFCKRDYPQIILISNHFRKYIEKSQILLE